MGEEAEAGVKNELIQKQDLSPSQPAASALAGFLSPNTKRAYERDLKDFFKVADLSALPMQAIIRVQPDDVTAWRDSLMVSLKPSSVARKLSALRSLYRYLMARGAVKVNPAHADLVRAPKRPTIQHTEFISWDDARAILRVPDRSIELGKRDYAALTVALNTGMRRGELCTLTDDNLKREAGRWCFQVRGKGEKERRIPIRDDVYEAVEDWRKVRPRTARTLLCGAQGQRFTEDAFWKLLKRSAKKSGLPEARVKSTHPHSLRAAFIMFLHEQGMKVGEIQQLVGHARGDTTLSYIRQLDLIKSRAPDLLKGMDGERKDGAL